MDKATIEIEINAEMHGALKECRAKLGAQYEGIELPHAVGLVVSENVRLREAFDAAVSLLDDTGGGAVNDKLQRWHRARSALANINGEPRARRENL